MRATIKLNTKNYIVDFSKPIDLSIPVTASAKNPIAWYIEQPKIEPVQEGKWTALVSEGASVNFRNIQFNPHGHGTHTECVGHITKKIHSINDCLKNFMFFAQLVTVVPEHKDGDYIITKSQLQHALQYTAPEALVIRTLPNSRGKKTRNWSHSNWPYLLEETAMLLKDKGIKHLLIDLPSVDRENDEGKLLAHRAFWNVDQKMRKDATITEMIYVPHNVEDGNYLLNLQIASFDNDASPSKPLLYALE